mmetsp:Transcript_95093/g.268609  ORF Transcript_95093/g.268609 Transcript_95093/m.268609 type:complete len:222 (+) Transcript_95093:717-1382(+)
MQRRLVAPRPRLVEVASGDIQDVVRLHREVQHWLLVHQILRHRAVLAQHLLGVRKKLGRVPHDPLLAAPHLEQEHVLIVVVEPDGLGVRRRQVNHAEDVVEVALRERLAKLQYRVATSIRLVHNERRPVEVPEEEVVEIVRVPTTKHLEVVARMLDSQHDVVGTEQVGECVHAAAALRRAPMQRELLPMLFEKLRGQEVAAHGFPDVRASALRRGIGAARR